MDLLRRPLILPSLALALSACVPELDSDESTVVSARVLAIIADPPEAAQREPVRYRALVADSSGVRVDAAPTWFHCLAQKPLAELGPVSPLCFDVASGRLQTLGQGERVEASVPPDACSLFGPNPPPPVEGQPPGRPVDADESGGYRIPVMVGFNAGAGQQVVLYEQRIACGLAGVGPALSAEFAQRYHPNVNPSVAALHVLRAGAAPALVGEEQVLEVAQGERVELEVAWPDCPLVDVCGDGVCGPDETRAQCGDDCTTVRGCGGQERFLVYDRERRELTTRREAVRAAWYVTGGQFEAERTGATDEQTSPTSKNGWRAPLASGPLTLWVVLRDARGGVGYRQLAVTVR